MNKRRKFILQSGMAATVFLVGKPFKIFTGAGGFFTSTSGNGSKVVFAHSGNGANASFSTNIRQIAKLKKNTPNLVLLHAGDGAAGDTHYADYDAHMNPDEINSVTANNYKIFYKGRIKIGVISAVVPSANLSAEINTLSSSLKKEKKCDLVICLSQLGYKNKNRIDDRTLAAESTHIDAIIGGHAENFSKQPIIAMNKNKSEVIINHAAGNKLAFRKIEIAFDESGKKNHISFTKTIPGSQEEGQS